jgi:hypothetical protein
VDGEEKRVDEEGGEVLYLGLEVEILPVLLLW